MRIEEFHTKLRSVSSKEEALELISQTKAWDKLIQAATKDVRRWWVVEPFYAHTENDKIVKIKAQLKSGSISIDFKATDLDDYVKIFNKSYRDIFFKKPIRKNSDLWNILVDCSHHFVSWGMEDPKKLWKENRKNKNYRYVPNVVAFSYFWMPLAIACMQKTVGESAVEMINDVIKKARHASQSPTKALNDQQARINGSEALIAKHALILSEHGRELNDVLDIIKKHYVKNVMNS